jgi:hypothetical protein
VKSQSDEPLNGWLIALREPFGFINGLQDRGVLSRFQGLGHDFADQS